MTRPNPLTKVSVSPLFHKQRKLVSDYRGPEGIYFIYNVQKGKSCGNSGYDMFVSLNIQSE
jgi:hypothetical protein